MKKPFQILSTAIVMIVFSCGIQNAEIRGTIKHDVSPVATNRSSLRNEPDPLLIDPAKEGLSKVDRRDHQPTKFQYRPSERTASYTIDKTDLAKTMVRINGPSGVN
jgi:hypothetical protein